MDIEVVKDADEVKEIIPVIKSAWGMNNIEQAIKDTVAAMRFHGGLILLAKEDDKVIGMNFSFAGMRKGKTYLYSHMTGVIDKEKYRGVGEKLKLKQKQWAIMHGYDLVAWTFDPLMSLNAHFNIHKLGAIARTYLRNFYGRMDDAINFGIPTDRFVAEWWIKIDRIKAEQPSMAIDCGRTILPQNLGKLPSTISVSIPEDFMGIKRKDHRKAVSLRLSSRKVFESLFRSGYVVTDYRRSDSSYILQKNEKIGSIYGKNIFS